ncbi:malto-oligosyltrehalose trehalohydrolase [Tropicimonas sp. IMCC34011]|uniref:malto-oligosyltrehalose trehalohydrolase n=1 Tax=Tropicimonas sp. IMCC34011 TaxID=2248759 RepID=UPI000E232514|nr:malto-oligosyltrehalose trehalohydrolase [Tropicimonas sp. IMCC34011]
MSQQTPATHHFERRWGTEPAGDGLWRARLWAPQAEKVELILTEGETRHAMERGEGGWWEAEFPAEAGSAYMFEVDGLRAPDPASRQQSGDVHSPSILHDPRGYEWRTEWEGRAWEEAVIYEFHVGAFTEEGTFAAAARELPKLERLGITAVEIMPVGQFPGTFGWGYDGVLSYAPHNAYGTPEDFKRFVEAAQGMGLMVLLDVVYNHFGPDGAYIHALAPGFFDKDRQTPWGDAIDYSESAVRSYFIENALYWLTEFRLDGLRLDATDQIRDPGSDPELMVELAEEVRKRDWGRPIHLTTEDNRNITRLHEPEANLYTGEWNDDWHHAIHTLLTGESEDYYATYAVAPLDDLVIALKDGYVEQGQAREQAPAGPPRGEPSAHLPWSTFVNFNQNHDQTGNRARGERLLELADDPRAVEIAHCLLCLSPFTPMLWMGEEAGERAPWLFFADFTGDLAEGTRKGRQAEFANFSGFTGQVPDPCSRETFEASRPFRGDPAEQDRWRGLTKELLRLRADVIVPLSRSGRSGSASASRTGPRSVAAEWPFRDGTLRVAGSFGTPPDRAPTFDPDFARGDIAADPYAFAMSVNPK